MNNNNQSVKKKRIKVYIPLFLVIVIVIVGGIIWYRQYKKYIKTDDAYIDTDNLAVSSKILGRIVKIYVSEGDSVTRGELLAELDSSDIVADKEQALAERKKSQAGFIQSKAQYASDEEGIKVAQIAYDNAKSDYERAQSQYNGGVIPEETYDHLRRAYETASAKLSAAKISLKVSEARIHSAKAQVESADASINGINTKLVNTKLISPINGLVAKRWLLAGDIVQPGQSVYTVTDNHNLWVLVNLEETKIANVHLNQKSLFTVDAFPGVVFTGQVFSIGSNTASQFSLIPPNNASGNFTKVTQRIPVKISIDETDNGRPASSYNIVAGMSVLVKIMKERR